MSPSRVFEVPLRNQSLSFQANQMPKVVKEMSNKAWQKEQERIEALRVRVKFEDEENERMVKANLEQAIIGFEAAHGEAKIHAERVLFRAQVSDQCMRMDKNGVTPDMKCTCGFVKGRGYACSFCARWKKALYGGDVWVQTGEYMGFLC